MKVLHQTDIDMPEWAINYLEYGEDGSLTPEDCAEVDAWLESMAAHGFTSPTFDYHWDSEHNGFYHYPAFGLGCGCIRTTVTQFSR